MTAVTFPLWISYKQSLLQQRTCCNAHVVALYFPYLRGHYFCCATRTCSKQFIKSKMSLKIQTNYNFEVHIFCVDEKYHMAKIVHITQNSSSYFLKQGSSSWTNAALFWQGKSTADVEVQFINSGFKEQWVLVKGLHLSSEYCGFNSVNHTNVFTTLYIVADIF